MFCCASWNSAREESKESQDASSDGKTMGLSRAAVNVCAVLVWGHTPIHHITLILRCANCIETSVKMDLRFVCQCPLSSQSFCCRHRTSPNYRDKEHLRKFSMLIRYGENTNTLWKIHIFITSLSNLLWDAKKHVIVVQQDQVSIAWGNKIKSCHN